MYEKKFNNYSYVRCGECGITGKKKSPRNVYRNQDLKTYLTKYQWAYRKCFYLPRLPENLREIFYEIKGLFNVATTPIEQMLRVSRWLKCADYESSSYFKDWRKHYKNRKNNKHYRGKRR